MSIDQALAQLEFSDKKGAQIIKEVKSDLGQGVHSWLAGVKLRLNSEFPGVNA